MENEFDGLDEAFDNDSNLIEDSEPFDLFKEWMELAEKHEINDPNAMSIATVDHDGMPNARMVLLKGMDQTGFTFYTNSQSQKGNELEDNMKAACVFHWKSLQRQIRIRGTVEKVSAEEADAYFASRSRGSRIGAWASQQSRPISHRNDLKMAVVKHAARFKLGKIDRPDYWNGYKITPTYMEFWMDKPFRLHDRAIFKRQSASEPWSYSKYFP
ncbi:MAG: pyridoxamine 5'-phosphate oxidase [Lentilitoribacter sp.]